MAPSPRCFKHQSRKHSLSPGKDQEPHQAAAKRTRTQLSLLETPSGDNIEIRDHCFPPHFSFSIFPPNDGYLVGTCFSTHSFLPGDGNEWKSLFSHIIWRLLLHPHGLGSSQESEQHMFKHSRHLAPAALRENRRIDRKKAKLQSRKEVLRDPAGFIDSVKPSHMWGHITLEAHFLTFTSSHNFYKGSTWHAFNLLKVVPAEMRGVPFGKLSAGWGD